MTVAVFAMISGGGTAGHVVPGLAVARALVDRGHDPRSIHYVGSERGVERTMVPDAEKKLSKLLQKNPDLANQWEGKFKLADDPRMTQAGWLIGTPGYLAPEILHGDDAPISGWRNLVVERFQPAPACNQQEYQPRSHGED